MSSNHLDLYKLGVEMADRESALRGTANAFFVTVNTALLAFLGLADLKAAWPVAVGGVVITRTRNYARGQEFLLPVWVTEESTDEETLVTPEPGEACRIVLKFFLISDDPEVRSWAREAIDEANQTQVPFLDPLTLAVGGLVLGGLILAARVKKVGPDGVEFCEGLPEQLANVLGAGANFLTISGGP